MVGMFYAGYPNRTAYDKKLPRGVAWEACCLREDGVLPIIHSGFHDPRGFKAAIRKHFREDGTLVLVHDGLLFVAVPEDYKTDYPDVEFDARVDDASGGCAAGWNVAEVMVRHFLMRNLDRIPQAAYRQERKDAA